MLNWNEEEYKYEIYPIKVIYKKRGEIKESYALPNKGWWVKTCKKHNFLELVEFKSIEITQNMQERFENIKNFDLYNLAVEYIEGKELTQNKVDYLLGKTDTLDKTINK